MPNKRDNSKAHLNAWVWETDMEILSSVADENNLTRTELVQYLISQLNNGTNTKTEIQKWNQTRKS